MLCDVQQGTLKGKEGSLKVRIQRLGPRGTIGAGWGIGVVGWGAPGGVKHREYEHKKEALNTYLPTLEEFEGRADVGNPVDPL